MGNLGSPGGGAEDLALTVLNRGGLAVFALGRDGAVYHRWQDRPGSRWHEWESLGGPARSLSVARTSSGGLALFVTGPDGRVGARYQTQPFARWTQWLDLQGNAGAVLGQQSYTEGLEAFVLGTDDEIRHAWCARLGTPWTEWQLLEREAAGHRLGASREERALFPGDLRAAGRLTSTRYSTLVGTRKERARLRAVQPGLGGRGSCRR